MWNIHRFPAAAANGCMSRPIVDSLRPNERPLDGGVDNCLGDDRSNRKRRRKRHLTHRHYATDNLSARISPPDNNNYNDIFTTRKTIRRRCNLTPQSLTVQRIIVNLLILASFVLLNGANNDRILIANAITTSSNIAADSNSFVSQNHQSAATGSSQARHSGHCK